LKKTSQVKGWAPSQGIPLRRNEKGSPGLSAALPPGEFKSIPWGKAELVSEGEGGIILAVGHFVETALKTAELLRKAGIGIAVANMRFVKPLDEAFLRWVAETYEYIFSLEDNTVVGGFGSGVNEFFTSENFNRRHCILLGFPDRFVEHGKPSELYEQYGLTPEHLSELIRTHILYPSQSMLNRNLQKKVHASVPHQSDKLS